MNKLLLPTDVQASIDELQSDASVIEVWLVGSQADGTATSVSDWDLLVLSARNAENRLPRRPGIDILWAGPSGLVLLEGQSADYAFPFAEFQWHKQSGTATYLGKKAVKREDGIAFDDAELRHIRPITKAFRVA